MSKNLIAASGNNDISEVKKILRMDDRDFNINGKNYSGFGALHCAVLNDHPKIVRTLVKFPGLDVNLGGGEVIFKI